MSTREVTHIYNYIKPSESSDQNDITRNFIDRAYNKCYSIEKSKISHFLKLVDNARLKNEKLHFLEFQRSDHTRRIGSGIMLDFDFYTNNDNEYLDKINFKRLIHLLCETFNNVIDFNISEKDNYEEDEYDEYDPIEYGLQEKTLFLTYCVILVRPNISYCNKENAYKYGLHILFPNIKTSKEVKRYMIMELSKNPKLNELFQDCNLINTDSFLDKNSAHVPNHLFGSCKKPNDIRENVKPYLLHDVYRVIIRPNEIDEPTSILESFKVNNINLVSEFSLNFITREENSIIKVKKFYSCKKQLESIILVFNEQVGKDDDSNIDSIINDLNERITKLSISEYNVYYLKKLLELLSVERIENYESWRNLLYAIAHESEDLKPLAKWVSKRSPSKYDESSFESMWNHAVDRKGSHSKPITMSSIIYWAREDNKEKFEELKDESVYGIMYNDIRNQLYEGSLGDYHIAKYLNMMFKYKFITVSTPQKGKYEWYQFMMKTDNYVGNHLYKWKLLSSEPSYLNTFISENMTKMIGNQVETIKTDIDNTEEEYKIKYYTKLIANLKRVAQGLTNHIRKNGIFKESSRLFLDSNFSNELNRNPYLLGVKNGVLVLNEINNKNLPKLIQAPHEHRISKSAPTNYVPYDSENEYIKKVEKLLQSLIPEHEKDAYHYLMYYLASCLDSAVKDSILLILLGIGSNGKSFLMEFMISTLGEDYTRKMPMSFLTDKRGKSSGADSSLMSLKDMRFVYYSENGPDDELNTAKMKEITGNETLSGRELFKAQENFRLYCNHLITTNHKFTINTTDEGTWRRIKTYTFKHKFKMNPDPTNPYDKKIDPEVTKTYVKDEKYREALLSILIKYYVEYITKYKGSMLAVQSKTIQAETMVYRNEQDKVNKYIMNYCVLSPDHTVDLVTVIDAYKVWFERYYTKITVSSEYILNMFKNSAIQKFIIENEEDVMVIRGIRFLDETMSMNINEKKLKKN